MKENQKQEYWRWRESKWINPNIKDMKKNVVTGGIDIGSTSTQAVIVSDGEILSYASMRTGTNSPDSAVNAMAWALEDTGLKLEDINYIIGTGYGRVNVSFADKAVTEITCHARGANYIYGSKVRTILDMGGQDCKAIHCDERGKVVSFMMNDKCAAGTGRGMEVIADLLAVPIEELGGRSLLVEEEPKPVSSICVIYAKNEATRLMHRGWTKEEVLAAYCHGMAIRVVNLLERNGMESEFAITGGIAKNIGVTTRVEKLLGIKALKTEWDTQIAGALGAALIAQDVYIKQLAKNKK